MAKKRVRTGVLKTFRVSEEIDNLLEQAYRKAGFKTLVAYMRWIAVAAPAPYRMPTKEEIEKYDLEAEQLGENSE